MEGESMAIWAKIADVALCGFPPIRYRVYRPSYVGQISTLLWLLGCDIRLRDIKNSGSAIDSAIEVLSAIYSNYVWH